MGSETMRFHGILEWESEYTILEQSHDNHMTMEWSKK